MEQCPTHRRFTNTATMQTYPVHRALAGRRSIASNHSESPALANATLLCPASSSQLSGSSPQLSASIRSQWRVTDSFAQEKMVQRRKRSSLLTYQTRIMLSDDLSVQSRLSCIPPRRSSRLEVSNNRTVISQGGDESLGWGAEIG